MNTQTAFWSWLFHSLNPLHTYWSQQPKVLWPLISLLYRHFQNYNDLFSISCCIIIFFSGLSLILFKFVTEVNFSSCMRKVMFGNIYFITFIIIMKVMIFFCISCFVIYFQVRSVSQCCQGRWCSAMFTSSQKTIHYVFIWGWGYSAGGGHLYRKTLTKVNVTDKILDTLVSC